MALKHFRMLIFFRKKVRKIINALRFILADDAFKNIS